MLPVTFSYTNYQADVVHLAGEFNSWSTTAPMIKKPGGVWTKTIYLAPGDYGYKFVVDGDWLLDPANRKTKRVDDVVNSKVTVEPAK